MLVAGAGASWGWWSLQRRRHERLGQKLLDSSFDSDTAVVFSVAGHAMTSRGHAQMQPIHLLYGLLQDETFTGAIKTLGGDPDEIETKVLADLDALEPDPAAPAQLIDVINYSYAVASHHDRKITVADLWGRLFRTAQPTVGSVDTYDLYFLLTHATGQPPLELAGRTDVAVVLRNDDNTPMQFVTWVLRDVFELSDADAQTRMLETHHAGRSVVGRFKAPIAKDKLIAVRTRAREQGFPLWIGLEDC